MKMFNDRPLLLDDASYLITATFHHACNFSISSYCLQGLDGANRKHNRLEERSKVNWTEESWAELSSLFSVPLWMNLQTVTSSSWRSREGKENESAFQTAGLRLTQAQFECKNLAQNHLGRVKIVTQKYSTSQPLDTLKRLQGKEQKRQRNESKKRVFFGVFVSQTTSANRLLWWSLLLRLLLMSVALFFLKHNYV